jgi:hypothetical protein
MPKCTSTGIRISDGILLLSNLKDQHICFWANISGESERITKTSFLKKRTGVMNAYYTSWFVLEKGLLMCYENSTVLFSLITISKSLYYPQLCIHIALITEVQDTEKLDCSFIIKTARKRYEPLLIFSSYFLQADTDILKNEWIKAINLAIFHNKNYGDDVRVFTHMP